MKTITVPTEIKMFGEKVQVLYTKKHLLDDPEVSGLSNATDLWIKISLQNNKTERDVRHTLFHEMVHIALGRAGIASILSTGSSDNLEEGVVICIENFLGPLLKFDRRKWSKTTTIEVIE